MNTRDRARLTLRVEVEKWPLKTPFRITGHTWADLSVVVVTLERRGCVGRGEAAGVYYLNDDAASMVKRIEAVRGAIEAGIDRELLQELLPAGGARNAVDCALWDLESKLSGRFAWEIAGLDRPHPLLTTFTCGADEPEKMAATARAYAHARAIKLKLTGEPVDAQRVRAVREARADVWLGVDANQGFTRASLEQLMPVLTETRVALIEQPFPIGKEALLDGLQSPIPIAADESVQTLADMPALVGRFNVVNIKLDKCGGLTEALAMVRAARKLGLDAMVGNMLGTSLAMAPAFLVGQLCQVVDLDGPIFLKSDRAFTVDYSNGAVNCADALWGSADRAGRDRFDPDERRAPGQPRGGLRNARAGRNAHRQEKSMPEASERREGQADVRMQWGIQIPLRDGVQLNAALYLPQSHGGPSPVICTLTPYVGQTSHHFALYFAERGWRFLTVDVRGRGNSEGEFRPFIQEAKDGYDVVEWLARQPYCNGKVAMWGGSYAGYDQWATAKECPPHLATIVPVASPHIGVDFPMRNNISGPYLMQWLTLVWGRTSQDKVFWDNALFWNRRFQRWFESGAPFSELDSQLGNPSTIFQEWNAHPQLDSYWDSYNPTAEQYSRLSIPVLTITGSYDGNQPGALMHYREHLTNAPEEARARHYLVIGPWDHLGTRAPKAEFGGIKVGPESLLDIPKLHLQWYAWTLQGGPKPEFLQKKVACYVMGAEKWRYADTLEGITDHSEPYFLKNSTNPADVFHSGTLGPEAPANAMPSHYLYDPRDVSGAAFESSIDPESLVDQRLIHRLVGKQFIYHSAPFEKDTEISGFFKLVAWLSIDQPDTDFSISVYEIGVDGGSLLLSTDWMRARYRESLREPKLIRTTEPLRYDFERFTFVSREVRQGNRLRLVIGPINSIHSQRNYNSGGVVAEESIKDARPVNVRLFHDREHPSVLYVPIGRPYAPHEPTAPAASLVSASHRPREELHTPE